MAKNNFWLRNFLGTLACLALVYISASFYQSLARTLPNTIDSWLQRIDLHQYYDQLMAAGWDDLDYLDFTDSDLQDAGIDVAAHRALVSATLVLFQ